MKRQAKTTAIKVIQQNYGQGWEDNSEYWPHEPGVFKMDLLKHDLKEYRLTGYPTRVISRRVEKETVNI